MLDLDTDNFISINDIKDSLQTFKTYYLGTVKMLQELCKPQSPFLSAQFNL